MYLLVNTRIYVLICKPVLILICICIYIRIEVFRRSKPITKNIVVVSEKSGNFPSYLE